MTKVLTQAEIDDILNSSIGTEHYYKHPMTSHLVYTDGIRHMALELQCYWLIDVIASHIKCVVKNHKETQDTFYVAELNVDDGHRAVFTINHEVYNEDTDETTDENVCYQDIPYADLPECQMKFFIELAEWDTPVFCLLQRSEH